MSVRNNYTQTTKCPQTTTTDCVTYVGVEIPCLGICTGDSLTDLETAIATKLCELVGDVNISTLTIPSCFTTAWATQDITILNVLNFLLEQACIQQNALSALTDVAITIDTPIEVSYPTCCTDVCDTVVNLTISAHFEKVLNCLCQQADRITELQAQVDLLPTATQFASLQQEVTDIKAAIIVANLGGLTPNIIV